MSFWKKKEKPPQRINVYKVDIQPDITAAEAAKIALSSMRFKSTMDRDLFFYFLPPECQRHIKKSERLV